MGLVGIVHHHKGYINRAIQRDHPDQKIAFTPGDYRSVRYSYRQHLPSGYICWALRPSPATRVVVLQVIQDCIVIRESLGREETPL